jgi:ribosome-associated protein
MKTALERTSKGAPATETHGEPTPPSRLTSDALLADVQHWLDEAKAEEISAIDIKGKSSIGDYMVIATGRSDRHVGAIADQLHKHLKEAGFDNVRVEGKQQCDWVLIDAGAIIVHVFRPEVREFYNLEKMWSADRPAEPVTH